MFLEEKIKVLAEAAKYDVSCSSSGSSRKNKGGLGSGSLGGICHSWADDGRCISLLKILFSNVCIYDCAYCVNRKSNPIARASFTVDEIIKLTINLYKRNYIEGLFLSSGVFTTPDDTMEKLFLVVKKLRTEHNFHGYIHLKAIPGATRELIRKAGLYVDRMSVNLELPSSGSLRLLAPQKSEKSIFDSMGIIRDNHDECVSDKKKFKKVEDFVPAGQSTQVIVGATPDTDLKIVNLSENLYKKFKLKRVYYSAYVPVNKGKNLPAIMEPPLRRENRLYQADWLLRFYNFTASEIVDPATQNLDLDFDPKAAWALRNLNFFPVEINKASYDELLRVPGIGVISARKILSIRRVSNINFDTLKKIRVTLKRAKYFITCNGKFMDRFKHEHDFIRNEMLFGSRKAIQLRLF